MKFLSAIAALAATAAASPLVARQTSSAPMATGTAPHHPLAVSQGWKWDADGRKDYPVHPSCNSTQRRQLELGLSELKELAGHARDHILRYGNSSTQFLKYFGSGTTAEPIGWHSRMVDADKTGMLFRCDDPDRNCETQEGKHPGTSAAKCSDFLTFDRRMGWSLARLERH